MALVHRKLRAVIDHYVEANNLGTTHVLRSLAPMLRDGGRLFVVASRAGSLRALAPALHPRFENLQSLDDVDRPFANGATRLAGADRYWRVSRLARHDWRPPTG